uniref:TF-B3 domain-containing protein n=2 Tax=Chenopodium quinoa TaxID=63459 RepID=A0A803MW04_CHEQI
MNQNSKPPKKRLSYRLMLNEEKEHIKKKDDDSSNNYRDEKKRKKSVDYYSNGIKKQKRLPSTEYASAVINRQDFNDDNDVRVVIVKKLENSDVNPHQARLSIPKSKCCNKFLSNREERFLQKVDKYDRKCKIQVKVRGCNSVKAHNMFLTRWDYPDQCGYRYVLNGANPSWNTLRREFRLEEGDVITVVANRSKEDGCLCFAIEGGELLRPSLTWGRKGRRS